MSAWTYVLPLDWFLDDILACCGKQHGPTAFVDRILHEWSHSLDANLAELPICLNSLVLLIRDDCPLAKSRSSQSVGLGWLQQHKYLSGEITHRMRSIQPRPTPRACVEPELAPLLAPSERPDEQDLCQL